MRYRGRFAPTPSGPLHAGSLLTALAGFLQARASGGDWLLRIDDLDMARCRVEHRDTILRQLEAHALHWDESPRLQSEHQAAYSEAFTILQHRAQLYACACTRAELAVSSQSGPDGPLYAGTCRERALNQQNRAIRLRLEPKTLAIDDRCQGRLERRLAEDVGDFVVRRADGQIAYQLACVVDEQAQRITEVVRGSDLIGSSLKQRYLQQVLDVVQPDYLHIPILLDAQGRKLSKQNHARALDSAGASDNLRQALVALGQSPPPTLADASPGEILQWAIPAWRVDRIPRVDRLNSSGLSEAW